MNLSRAMTAPARFPPRVLWPGLGKGAGEVRKSATKDDPLAALLASFEAAFRGIGPDHSAKVQRGASSAAYVLAHFHSARALLREARPRILPDDVFAFSSLMKSLEAAVIHYVAGALAILEKRGGDFSQLVQPLADAESAAIELMHVLDRSGEAPKAGEPSSHPVFGLLSPAGAAQAPLLELALVVIAARREIEREDAGRGAEVLSPGAVRSRRLRARRRRRVVMQVAIDVYAGDLELLRRAGLLSAGGSSNPEAVADALQILLARAFLSNPQHGSWRDRFSRQVPRLNSLGSSGDAQE